MGKKKNQKKKNQKKDARADAIFRQAHDLILAEDEEDDDCTSIRSDAATLPSSDDTIAAAAANDCDVSIEGMSIRDDDPQPEKTNHKRKRMGWKDLCAWWDGECAPFTRILNDLMFDMNRSPSDSLTTAFNILQDEDINAFDSLRDHMISTSQQFGVDPVPAPTRIPITYPKIPLMDREEIINQVMRWNSMQGSYLPSGRFDNLDVGRWGPVMETHPFLSPLNPVWNREAISAVRGCGLDFSSELPPSFDHRSQHQNGTHVPSSPLPSQSTLRPHPDYIKVQLVELYSPDGLTTVVSLKTSTKMGKLKERHSKRMGRPVRALCYRYKGKTLRDNDTVKDLGMRENDMIHVMDALQRRH